MSESLVDWDKIDLDRPILDHDAVYAVLPHRHEMALLNGILLEDFNNKLIVGYVDAQPNAFWVKGHFPNFPVMPGVLICEAAAQLCAFLSARLNLFDEGTIGLGALDEVRFRGPVLPNNRLIIGLKVTRSRPNALVSADFKGYIDQNLVVEGAVKGIILRT